MPNYYFVVINDYEKNNRYIHTIDQNPKIYSLLSAMLVMEDIAIAKIFEMNGIEDIKIYKSHDYINFRGQTYCYIESISSNKLYIKKCTREYGIIYNNIKTSKIMRIEIVNINVIGKHKRNRYNLEYDNRDAYNELINELKHKNIKKYDDTE